jgi:phosphopantetheinyl transferase (holo-ACP synthase)
MLGNDVVDLSDPETLGPRHARFDARVFTCEERAALAAAPDPERLRWSLWAAKEAAYKCLKKLAPETCFSPARFAVRLDTETRGTVDAGGRRLRVALFREGDALHAVASDEGDPGAALCALAQRTGAEDPSQAVRALARQAAAAELGCHPEQLSIVREGRRPRLRRIGGLPELDLSLSHHGRFVAAALERARGAGAP